MPTSELRRSFGVVLLAHGPASKTLTAARHLESVVAHVDAITVVASTAPGLTAVERAADRGYRTSPDHGPSALSKAIECASNGGQRPVLVLHDDVSIDADSIEILVDAHLQTGEISIPAGAGDQVDEADVVCAVGTSDQLTNLSQRAGFGPGMRTTGPFVVPAGASAVHRADCQQRMVAERDLDRPLLVAALIVRDESEHLAACLESLDGVVDRIELADTGSLDDTVAIAKRFGANVMEIGWQNDFAWARNQVLERCRDASYMLWVDADERFSSDDPVAFRALLGTYQRLYPSYSMNLRNFRSDDVETHSFVARRIVDPALVSFEGALHEQPVRLDRTPLVTAFLSNVSISHLGYDESVVDLRQKMERNFEIAQQSFDDDPSESHAVHLARALKGASADPESTLRQIEPLMDTISHSDATVRALINGVRAELLLSADRLDEAVTAAKETLDLVPADAIAGAVLAESLFRSNRVEEVLTNAADYESRPSPTPLINDIVAQQTRARVIFEAGIRVGDFAAAIAQLNQLPQADDPWPVLADRLAIEEFTSLATTAGEAGDERFFRALVSCIDLDATALDAAIDSYCTQHELIESVDLVESLRSDLQLADSAPEVRKRFEKTGEFDDALTYANCLIVGFIDLQVELDDLASHSRPVGAALEIAAEGNQRRGRSAAALTDATASLAVWPGAARAAIIAAQRESDSDNHAGAIAIVKSVRLEDDFARIPRSRRHQLASIASVAHVATGELAAAVSEAVEIVEDGGTLEHWDRLLVASESDMQALALVLGLALLGDEVAFIDAVARAVAPARTAEICGTYLALGGRNPDAVSTGVLAALMASQSELALVIADHGPLLPDEIRARLATHLRSSGARDVALRLMVDLAERQAA